MKHAHYSKRMFLGRIARQSFFLNDFADFFDVVQVKKRSKFCLAVNGFSN